MGSVDSSRETRHKRGDLASIMRVSRCDLGDLLRHGKIRGVGVNRNIAPSTTLVGAGMACPANDHTIFNGNWTAHFVGYYVMTLRPLSEAMDSGPGLADGADMCAAAGTSKLLSDQGQLLYRCWKTLMI